MTAQPCDATLSSRSPIFIGLLVLSVLGLTACGTDQQRPTTSVAPPTTSAKSAATDGKSVAVPSQGLSQAAMPALPRINPRHAAEGLIGRSAQELTQGLGQPDFRRSESPAESWQYRQGACVLDVHLYAEPNGLRVQHAEIRSRHPAVDVSACGGLIEQLRGQLGTPAQGA